MTVFKHAMKAVWKNKVALIIYAVLFAIFIVSVANEEKNTAGYTTPKIDVMIDDRSGDAVGRTIKTYFQDDRVTLKRAEEDEKRLMTSISEVNLIVTIHPSAEKLIATEPEKVISIYHTEEQSGIEAAYAMNELVGYMGAYAPDYDKALEMMDTKADAILVTKDSGRSLGNFYKLVGFFLTAMLMFNIGLVNHSLHEKNFYKRTAASPITALRYDGELFLAQALVALFLVIVMVAATSVVIPSVRPHVIVTGVVFFVYALSILGLVNLLTALSANKQVVAAVANVFSMLLATTGGAFIPSDMLPDWMIRLSRAFPFYYFGENAARYEYDSRWFRNLGIMLLFGLAYFLLQSVIQKKKRTAA